MQQARKTSSLRNRFRTLVLNADGRPLSTWPLHVVSAQEALSTVWRDRAVVVETWEGAFFHSPSVTMAVPKVMMLREFVPVYGAPKFTRLSIYLRDHFTCQYCGLQFDRQDLTYDHVIPRSKKGETVWENIATACLPCNTKKENRVDMVPIRKPFRPTNVQLLQAGLEYLPNDIKQDFSSWLYWSAELKCEI